MCVYRPVHTTDLGYYYYYIIIIIMIIIMESQFIHPNHAQLTVSHACPPPEKDPFCVVYIFTGAAQCVFLRICTEVIG